MRNLNKMKSNQSGLSLVELMVAMVIGLSIMAGVFQLVVTNNENYKLSTSVATVQENGQFGLNYLVNEIRMAGYSGNEALNSVDNANQDNYLARKNRIATLEDTTFDFNGVSNSIKSLYGYYSGEGQVPPFILLNGFAKDGDLFDVMTVQRVIGPGEFGCAGDPVGVGERQVAVSQLFVVDNELRCTSYHYQSGDTALHQETEVLFKGVDSFQVLYGVDFQQNMPGSANYDPGNGAAKVYVNASELRLLLQKASLTNANIYPKVVSARISLLMKGQDNTDAEAVNPKYVVLDKTYDETAVTDSDTGITLNLTDGVVRRIYTSTIELRNVERSI